MVPPEQAQDLKAASALLTYGWGMIPVDVQLGGSVWKTSLFPKAGSYLVPIKAAVRRAHQLEAGERVTLRLEVRSGQAAPD